MPITCSWVTWNRGPLKGCMFPLCFPLEIKEKGKRNFSLWQGLEGSPLEEVELTKGKSRLTQTSV